MSALGKGNDLLQIRRVRLTGAADGLRARLRLEAALAGLAPASLGLPPRALLIVKRLEPTARLRLDRPGAAVGFGQAVRADLERSVRQAGRPWGHPEEAGAEAVLFADESELVACLLRDWLRGSLASRWWGGAVLDGLPAAQWWRRAVLPRGELLPAVLAHLARQGEAVAWATQFGDDEAARAESAVRTAHGLDAFVCPLARDAPPPLARQAGALDALPPTERRASLEALGHLAGIVPEILSAGLSLPQRRLLALALGLQRASAWVRSAEFRTAWHALEAVGPDGTVGHGADPSTAPGTGLQNKGGGVAVPGTLHSLNPLPPEEGDKNPSSQSELATPVTGHGIDPSTAPRTGSQDKGGGVAPPASRQDTKHSTVPAENAGTQPPGCEATGSHPSSIKHRPVTVLGSGFRHPSRNDEASGQTADFFHPEPAQEFSPSRDGIAPSDAVPGIDPLPPAEALGMPLAAEVGTEFGGLFYLLNVALALGLYGDFTQPRRPGIALSPWDWLALVGDAWFGEAFRRDPLWRLLAGLAGRPPSEAPGRGFTPPDSWSVPDAWLAPWGRIEAVQVGAGRRRLRVWHPAGFIVLDVARKRGVAPLAQARALCARRETLRRARCVPCQANAPARGRFDGAPPSWRLWGGWRHLHAAHRFFTDPPRIGPYRAKSRLEAGAPTALCQNGNCHSGRDGLARWLGWLLPYLAARLGLALGMDDPAQVKDRVCRHGAKIHCTATTLDVVLSLETLPIELRLAGLDRDPGWMPAAGRVFAFHFQ